MEAQRLWHSEYKENIGGGGLYSLIVYIKEFAKQHKEIA
jgi:hypothetical protein